MEIEFAPTGSNLLRVPEIAIFLNISRSHTYRLIRDGRIPSIRMGRTVRVRKEDLDQFVRDALSPELDGALSQKIPLINQ